MVYGVCQHIIWPYRILHRYFFLQFRFFFMFTYLTAYNILFFVVFTFQFVFGSSLSIAIFACFYAFMHRFRQFYDTSMLYNLFVVTPSMCFTSTA